MASKATSSKSTAAKTNGRKKTTASTNGRRTQAGNGRSNGKATGAAPLSDAEVQQLIGALRAVRDGDFTARLPQRKGSALAEVAAIFNDLVELNLHQSKEFGRVSRIIGREGRMTVRLAPGRSTGQWAQNLESINALIDDLVRPTTEVARVIQAVAEGDLTQKMQLKIEGQPVKGEFQRIGTTVNSMVDQLSSFSNEVTRVAREVGTEGKLGGQAKVKGVSGTWKDLTDSVNQLAGNLTAQVRDIAQVTTAVAKGDL